MLEQYTLAYPWAQKSLVLFPEDNELKYRRAVLDHCTGQVDDAMRTYRALRESSVSVDEHDTISLSQRASHNLGVALFEEQRYEECQAIWRELISDARGYRLPALALFELFLKRGRERDADEHANGLLTSREGYTLGRSMKAHLAERSADVLECKRHWEDAARYGHDDLLAIRGLCRFFARYGPSHELEPCLLELVCRAPCDASAHYSLGKFLADQGRAQEAVTALQTSISLFPQNPSAFQQLSRALRQLGDVDRAEEAQKMYRVLQTDVRPATTCLHLVDTT